MAPWYQYLTWEEYSWLLESAAFTVAGRAMVCKLATQDEVEAEVTPEFHTIARRIYPNGKAELESLRNVLEAISAELAAFVTCWVCGKAEREIPFRDCEDCWLEVVTRPGVSLMTPRPRYDDTYWEGLAWLGSA